MLHVSLVALPNVLPEVLLGAMSFLNSVSADGDGLPGAKKIFQSEIVSIANDPIACFSDIKIAPHHSLSDLQHTDIIYLLPIAATPATILNGQEQQLFTWICKMHQQGAVIYTSDSGSATTAIIEDSLEATTRWGCINIFQQQHPEAILRLQNNSVQSEPDRVTINFNYKWQDLVLHLIARYAGVDMAQHTANRFSIAWQPSQLSCSALEASSQPQHFDPEIQAAQQWLARHAHQPNAATNVAAIVGLTPRTFRRRFKEVTGLSPTTYVQSLRIEQAKKHLKSTNLSVDNISTTVGYGDPASFRVLFKRRTGLTPGDYRRQVKMQREI